MAVFYLSVTALSVNASSAKALATRVLSGGTLRRWSGWGLGLALTLTGLPEAQAQTADNPVIQVGIHQRFGEDSTDKLVIDAPGGGPLTLEFATGGQPQTVTTTQVMLDIRPQALPQTTPDAALVERVVLSNHRSFETAEYSAQQWQQRGIPAEIAQPGAWEVWASRESFTTPLLRRLLVQSLQSQGFTEIYLDSQLQRQRPQAAFVADGYRYHRDFLTITAPGGQLRVNQGGSGGTTRIYGGRLRLQPNTYGTYTVVNDVPIETYLRGVVPYEIGPGAPPPTIEAQAILARTYALRNLRRFAIDNYQLCADTQCQVYRGITGATAGTDRAIAATRSQVLTYQNELVDALYSSTTGGVTAPFSHVWDGADRPYLRSVVDSVEGSWDLALRPLDDEANVQAFISLEGGFNEDTWDLFRWDNRSDLPALVEDLRTYLGRRQHPFAGLSQITSITVAERATSGRVQRLDIATDVGTVSLYKDEVVRALTPPRSLLFYVAPLLEPAPPTEDNPEPPPQLVGYRFVGGGWGHGVGMSQTGAYNLGRLGWSSSRIVAFYYPGTTLKLLDETVQFWSGPTSDGTP